MLYLHIFLLLFLLISELIVSNVKFTPTTVMLSIWLIIVGVCGFYEEYFWELSDRTLSWISFGCFAFFFGGILGKLIARVKIDDVYVEAIPKIIYMPAYFIMFALFYFMTLSGAKEDDNWYIGIRKIINYGEPDWSFTGFGYLYYIIFPILYISAVKYHSGNMSKSDRRMYALHFTMCVIYSLMSTAKLKLLLAVVPVFFIRNYFKKVGINRLIMILFFSIAVFFLSLFLLDKLSAGDDIIDTFIFSVGNYTFFNVFAIDYLDFKPMLIGSCTENDKSCSIMPFFEFRNYKTNIYTVMYSFSEYGLTSYILFQFLIGLVHNTVDKIARRTKNSLAIVFSSVLYVPLVFQIMDNQYTASKYMLYIMGVSYIIYFIKSRRFVF
ncbi:oligosaccharide repeat unit polymerase [Aeromonas caviae]|uniref:oligosaccharide repeat unit polymerase n=1 Tax=Aeromonas caviae TaxID=648 RepID=UPI0038D03C54